MFPLGRRGVNLVDALDAIDPSGLSRSLNVVSRFGSPLMTRLGQTSLATTTGTDRITRIVRLNDPGSSSYTRLAGSSTNVYRGQSGALTLIDSNYSGDPLTFAAVSMPLGNAPFVFIGDRSRNRKVDRTHAVSVIGLPPGGIISVTLQAQESKSICTFDAGDPGGASAAANWTMTAGQDRSDPPVATGAPVATDTLGAGDLLVTVTTDPTGAAAGQGYDSIISIARTLDLTTFGSTPITDDDLIHLRINVSDPSVLEEIKIYFVCSTPFVAGAVPGNSTDNSQAWYKAIRPNDFTDFHNRQVSSTEASDAFRTNQLLQTFKADDNTENPRSDLTTIGGITESARLVTPTFPAGRNVWGEFGILGIPLRRGDFSRVGTEEVSSPSWESITGIVIVIQTNTDEPITITFADWSVDGGGNPDTSEPDAQAYDYRVRAYNIVTGAKGNPSPVQAEAAWVNPVRQKVVVVPNATFAPPSADIRQQLFRRGGLAAASTDWFFVGQNSSDGGPIEDNTADTVAIADEALEIDNDQPVTSVNASGTTILNQVVPVFFMVEDYCFALGDPNQPGRLYRSKQGMPESWPATDYQDVCAASEELMNGGVVANAGFVFSRTRMYSILLNADGTWTTEPTGCQEGMGGRWWMAVTPFGVAFGNAFGIRLTQGSAPEDISSDQIGPLFRGETIRGLSPIDLSVPTALQLEYHDHELWFTYQDTGGARRHLIYNFFDKTWRPYLFSTPVATVYSEPLQGTAASLLLGSNAAGAIYTHSGFTDNGTAIPYALRTGAYAFGTPRNEKLLSEIVLDGDLQTADVTVQALLNEEATSDTAQTVTGTAGYRRYVFEPFGVDPQHARNVSIDISGNAPTDASLSFDKLGIAYQLIPAITHQQPTPWEELPGGEGYCIGVMITCDTGGADKTVDVEYTVNNGTVQVAASLTINANGRRKLPFTWPAVLAQQIRLRPTGACEPWIRYKVEWLADREPPRVQGWDTNWQAFGTYADKWLKGIIIEADTLGAVKTVVIDVDQQPATVSLGAVVFDGRGVQQFSFAKVRGRLFRLRSTDVNYGKLFSWQPIFDEEPLALRRWQTQERPHEGMAGRWQKPLEAFLSVRADSTVGMRIVSYGLNGVVLNESSYTILSTLGAKQKVRVPLQAAKGVLFEYFLSSTAGFYVYREESEILVEDWASGQAKWTAFFPSNDDLDRARQMGNAVSQAITPGGA